MILWQYFNDENIDNAKIETKEYNNNNFECILWCRLQIYNEWYIKYWNLQCTYFNKWLLLFQKTFETDQMEIANARDWMSIKTWKMGQ
jgi:hypothetical protein